MNASETCRNDAGGGEIPQDKSGLSACGQFPTQCVFSAATTISGRRHTVGNHGSIKQLSRNDARHDTWSDGDRHRHHRSQCHHVGSRGARIERTGDWRSNVRKFAEINLKHPAWGASHSTRDYEVAKQLAAADDVTLDDDVLYAAAVVGQS